MDISYQLTMLCPINFEEIIENGLVIERALIAKGTIKLYNNNNRDQALGSSDKI